MARNKETSVLLVDIGPSMHAHLGYVSKCLSALVQRKLMHNGLDEMGLVLFGASETDNELNIELGGYENIMVSRPVEVIAEGLATQLEELPKGDGASDLLDAIVTGMDLIIKKIGVGKKGKKRLYLITDGAGLVREPDQGTKEEQVDIVSTQMQGEGISMDVVLVRPRMKGKGNLLQSKSSQENEFLLRKFASQAQGDLVISESYTSLYGAVRTRAVTPTTLYRGDMELTPNMKVQVWVYKKVSTERLPTLKIFSDKAPRNDSSATHEIKLDTEYKSSVDLDVTIPPEQRVKAYKYGPQFIPISSTEEDTLKFKAEKGLKLVGFTDAANVPRHYYMKEANVFVPEPGNKKSITAVSALVKALSNSQKVAIVRCVWRQGQTSVVLGVLTPNPSTEPDVADSFYFNVIPFTEDLREFPFASFTDRPASQQPSSQQQEAADALVQAMDLAPFSGEELLQPERTVNPVLQRFYRFMYLRSLNPEAEVPALDAALTKIVELDQELDHKCNLTLSNFSQQFTLTPSTKKEKGPRFWKDHLLEADGKAVEMGEEPMKIEDGGQISLDLLTVKKVEEVGSLNPVQDFDALLARRDSDEWIPKAIMGIKKVIMDLLNSAYNGNTYEKAMACLVAFRTGCVVQEEPGEFNGFLRELRLKCFGKRIHDFWMNVTSKAVTLISNEEAPDSDVSKADAEAFLMEPKSGQGPPEGVKDEIDELDDLLNDIM